MKRVILAVVVFLVGCAGEPRHGDACTEEEARTVVCGVSPRAGEDQVVALRCDPDTNRLNAIALCVSTCETDGTRYACDGGEPQVWHEDVE